MQSGTGMSYGQVNIETSLTGFSIKTTISQQWEEYVKHGRTLIHTERRYGMSLNAVLFCLFPPLRQVPKCRQLTDK